MLKFMVVLYRRPDLTAARFRRHLREVHAPLARNLPGLRKYVQNHAADDPKRESPGWDAIVELYFDDRAAMEGHGTVPRARRRMPISLGSPI